MMIRILISWLLIFTTMLVSAQLKVHRNGDVTVGGVTNHKMSKLTVSGAVTTDGIVVPVNEELVERSIIDEINQNTLSSIMLLDVKTYALSTDTLEAEKQSVRYVLSPETMNVLYPSLVCQSENGTKGINYTELIPLLVCSIQELKHEIDSLKAYIVSQSSRQTRSEASTSGSESRFKAVLMQNKPNPVKDQTMIEYCLVGGFTDASLRVYDMSGRIVKSFDLMQGINSITMSASELPAGIYIYSLIVDNNVIDTKKMIILK